MKQVEQNYWSGELKVAEVPVPLAGDGNLLVASRVSFVDALTFLAGSLPIEVHAIAARNHADGVSILLKFSDGSTGTIVDSSLGDPNVPKEYLEIFSEGCVVQLDDFQKLTVSRRGKSTSAKAIQDKGQHNLVAAFFEATRGLRPRPISLADLPAVSEATIATYESLRIGTPVHLSGFNL